MKANYMVLIDLKKPSTKSQRSPLEMAGDKRWTSGLYWVNKRHV